MIKCKRYIYPNSTMMVVRWSYKEKSDSIGDHKDHPLMANMTNFTIKLLKGTNYLKGALDRFAPIFKEFVNDQV